MKNQFGKNIRLAHGEHLSLNAAVLAAKKRIMASLDTAIFSQSDKLEILEQLTTSTFGRSLLTTRVLSAYWTDYLVNLPKEVMDNQDQLLAIDKFLFLQAPITLATRERGAIFRQHSQAQVKSGAKLLCLPCGLMNELLMLDFSAVNNIELYGIDYDPKVLELAKDRVKSHPLAQSVKLIQEDAWNLKYENYFDLISNNGLVLYVNDLNRVKELFAGFYRALAQNGKLITSTVTPPPTMSQNCEWALDKLDQTALLKQKIIFGEIINVTWQNFYSSRTITTLLKEVGFCDIKVYYDKCQLFPTITGVK